MGSQAIATVKAPSKSTKAPTTPRSERRTPKLARESAPPDSLRLSLTQIPVSPPSAPESLPREMRTRSAASSVVDATRREGEPLPTRLQQEAQSLYGHDFGRVRVHADDFSASACSSLGAAAYTIGTDIVFGSGRYAPDTPVGRLLLHHELRHVAQQRSAVRVERPELDKAESRHESNARAMLDTSVEPLPIQCIQCAPEDIQFSLSGGAIDTVGRTAFGDAAWPFLKAVFEGFIGGLLTDVQSGRAEKAKDHLKDLFYPWNAAKFYGGYLVGLVIGLVSPITDLVKGIIGVIKLGVAAAEWLAKWSPVGIAISPERQQKIMRLSQKFQELSEEWGKAASDFLKDPKGTIQKFAGFLNDLMQLALGKAHEIGSKAAHSIFEFLEKKFYDMGESIGETIGALIAQVLLLVFSDAIGNLISKGASLLGKAAEFIAGKAVEIFEWVKGLASEFISLVRGAVKGALKMFEGLANKLIDAFDALKAIFVESEALEAGGETVAAGVGKVRVSGPAPNVFESRMVSSTRTAPATVADLKPPKVHPSNVGKELPKRPSLGKAPFDEPLTKEEMGLTKDQLRQKHILEEQAERQRGARPATKEEAKTGQGRREARTPGKSIPLRLERGQFAHEYAELLIPESELPSGLSAEVTAELPGGKVRLDRVDFEKGVYYEIKPDTPAARQLGADQIRKYAEYMNRNYPLKGGKKWEGRVVTYGRAEAIALFGL